MSYANEATDSKGEDEGERDGMSTERQLILSSHSFPHGLMIRAKLSTSKGVVACLHL